MEINQNLWNWINKAIFTLPSKEYENNPFFNPYSSVDGRVDLPHAHWIRRQNLHNYLSSFPEWPRCLVVGEAPGWRGCRFSGVPFTSEAQLVSGRIPFPGSQSSLRSSPYCEASATIFWRVMRPYHPQFLVWNCIPIHPFEPGVPLSNRRPTEAEIGIFAPLLAQLISLLAPNQVIAMGKSAERALFLLGIPCISVRHPSHGGSKEFGARMARILQSPHVEHVKQV